MKKVKQQYTSADTSINSKKLPRIYSLVHVNDDETVIDYGCGKFFDLYHLGNNFFGYDPFNRDDKEVLNRKYDVAFCSNVLNVIAEQDIRLDVLKTLKSLADRIYITVYEGNKSGKGKVTKKDCFQLNWRHKNYIPELVEVFGEGNVKFTNGRFECVAM